jgi:hypothetical protein
VLGSPDVQFREIHRKTRRAISPLLAELMIIVVSIVAGVSVGGFGFQVAGNAASSAVVTASAASCSVAGRNETCSLQLQNSGASSVQTIVCSLGSSRGNLDPSGTVPAGGSLNVNCTVTEANSPEVGSLVTGWVALSNGAYAYFAGN